MIYCLLLFSQGVKTMHTTAMGNSPVENTPVYSEKKQPVQQGEV